MNIEIKDLFKKSIDRNIEGVVTIGNELDEKIFQELDEYVVTNEIVKHFRTFFRKSSDISLGYHRASCYK